jgi:starch synthase (maltosyl-transferring)
MNTRRVVVENVTPQVDYGRYPAKYVVGEEVLVEADLLTDGHDEMSAVLRYRFLTRGFPWKEIPMIPLVNDRWRAAFPVTEMGRYLFTVDAWVDPFKTWRRDLARKVEANQDVSTDLLIGSKLIAEASNRATDSDRKQLLEFSQFLQTRNDLNLKIQLALDSDLAELLFRFPPRENATRFERELPILVERLRARFSSWYEIFPRSCGEGRRHGTFSDCEKHLGEIARMGFDVLYFPPIHPIGRTHRKGPNNSTNSKPEDCGSPWAIGSTEGGHKSIHPELGTIQEFRKLVEAAKARGIEIALDLALQCSPDHPYVSEHPEWFKQRPDGSIQYAENPPKKYEDIYPFNFEGEETEPLWNEMKSIIDYWIDQGILIFRVDNPHTKPFAFWEWVIHEVRKKHPEVIFLSEAFTRPKIMYQLAKLGFSQSYTYFAWRNTKWELTEYFRELTEPNVREYFRPNAWPNTPDILTDYLQTGGPAAFRVRIVLAATLSANFGIYGPAYELCEAIPREPQSEEYLNSEKYEIRSWDLTPAEPFRDFIARLNGIRRENPALQIDRTLRFHDVDNEQLICYSKRAEDDSNLLLMIVNLDPHHTHSGVLSLPLEELGIAADKPFQVHDLLTDARYLWDGPQNYVELNPNVVPAHVFTIHRKVRSEHDFEYFV